MQAPRALILTSTLLTAFSLGCDSPPAGVSGLEQDSPLFKPGDRCNKPNPPPSCEPGGGDDGGGGTAVFDLVFVGPDITGGKPNARHKKEDGVLLNLVDATGKSGVCLNLGFPVGDEVDPGEDPLWGLYTGGEWTSSIDIKARGEQITRFAINGERDGGHFNLILLVTDDPEFLGSMTIVDDVPETGDVTLVVINACAKLGSSSTPDGMTTDGRDRVVNFTVIADRQP